MSTKEIRNLYRNFFRLYRQWPPELQRSKKFRQQFLNNIKTQFRENGKVSVNDVRFGGNEMAYDAWRQGAFQRGLEELHALRGLLNNNIEKEVRFSLKLIGCR
jgi:hypothetical protein